MTETTMERKGTDSVADITRTTSNSAGKKLRTEKFRADKMPGSTPAQELNKLVDADAAAMAAARGFMKPAGGSGNCCSDSGEYTLLTTRTEKDAFQVTLDVYQLDTRYCWGGGTPGVHYGYIFSCGHFGTDLWPDRAAYFTNINSFFISDVNPTWASPRHSYFNWSEMGYSLNTGWEDWEQAAVNHRAAYIACIQWTHPSLHIWAHANGEWDLA